jgi:DNA-binding NarL/FixJ family response regulator
MITVALVDDHAILRDPLAKLIDQFGGYKVSCLAGNGKELVDHIGVTGKTPDMVILDLNMPVMDGYDTALWLRGHHPGAIIMILTAHDSEMVMIRLLRAGVKGFMQKDITPSELQRALAEVREKGFYYWGDSSRLANLIRKGVTDIPGSGGISLSENEIVLIKLSCSEMTYKAIADTMKLSPRTIDSMREALFEKLSVKNRVGLAMYAVRNGLVML